MRKKVSSEVETAVLAACRRRCCVCFGLHRDTAIEQGQIAHLDQDSRNSAAENLVFLCLPHHDEYDSSTSQSKGLTLAEVRRFRDELHHALQQLLNTPVRFGHIVVPTSDIVEGRFVRKGERDIAELQVRRVGSHRIQVSGIAFWGTHRPELFSNGVRFRGGAAKRKHCGVQ
jgi:hypothetical protein